MNKWKDTARTTGKITKRNTHGEIVVLLENEMVIVEREISKDIYLVTNINPRKPERRQYKLNLEEIKLEDYYVTRDINVQMLLADGWDAQDLLRRLE
jgi:hypothetical protein